MCLLSKYLPVNAAHTFFFCILAGALTTSATAQRLPPAGSTLPQTYIIARTDRLRIEVYQEDDLSLIARVDAQGAVNLPLVGEVFVEGKTIVQAQKLVELAYVEGRFIKFPKVTINVEEYAPREVSIHGQVRNPGRIPLPVESTITILDLVTKAGGMLDTAKGNAVTLIRVRPDGTKLPLVIDVDALINGKDSPVPPEAKKLEPGDIVNVPERRF